MGRTRGLILAGRETRDELSLIAGSRAAQAIPVANRPLVNHALAALRSCGIEEVGVVVSRQTAAPVRDALGPLADADVSWFEHAEPPTLVESLLGAREFVAGGPFVVHHADSLVLQPLGALVDEFEEGDAEALLLVREAKVGGSGRVARLDGRRLLRLVADQPALPPAEQALAGVHLLRAGALEAAERLAGEPGADQTIAALGATLTAGGGRLETRVVAGAWKYAGSVDALLEANRMVLDELEPDLFDADLSSARIEGRVVLHDSVVLERTTVRGPAIVGPGAVLVDTFVGPYTSIGERVRLEGAEIEHSVVLAGATIRHPGSRVEASLVGRDAVVSRDFSLPASLRLRVGQSNEVWLS